MSEANDEKTQTAINYEIHSALYGTNGEPGIISDVKDIKQIINAFRLFGKAVMWLALVLGSVGTAVGGGVEAIKFYLKHK